MVEQLSSFEGIELTENDELTITHLITTNSNPAISGLAAPVGSLALSTTTNGRAYYKHNTGNIDWVTVFTQLPNEFGSLLSQKTGLVLNDRIVIEDSADGLNKKYTTLQEVKNLIGRTDLAFSFSRKGNNITTGTYLLTGDAIPSNVVGLTFSLTSGSLDQINLSTEDVNTYDLRIFYHDGAGLNQVNITTISVTATRNVTYVKDTDYTETNPPLIDKQIGIEVTSGTAKNINAELIMSGL